MSLTDSEKRDLISLIENNKPIPEEYRFKIFKNKNEIELLWNGKSYETTNVNLPFQIIENVDEPRKKIEPELQGNLFDERGRKLRGWTNKLIWGNNSLILSSLLNGPTREDIEKQGGIKLVYIDPPFDVGDDFEFEVQVGKQKLPKKRNALEQLAFSDTWGKGEDSFLSMIYERLVMIKSLMAEDASIYVHCDYRLNPVLRLVLDELFDKKNFVSQIIWKRTGARSQSKFINHIHDCILFYCKDKEKIIWNSYNTPYTDEYVDKYYRHKDKNGRKFQDTSLIAPGKGYEFAWKGVVKRWRHKKEKMEELEKNDLLFYSGNGVARFKRYLDKSEGVPPQDIWLGLSNVNSQSNERLNYPTQKPEELIERIIKSSSNENDLVADFFCGSGTTLAVAEKLNRKWIGSDLGKFAIHTSRKRLISIQRNKEKNNENFRPFEVLNLGKYQREFFFKDYLYKERDLKNDQAANHYYDLILNAYKAKKVEGFDLIKGLRNNKAVAIGPFNLQVTRLFVEKAIQECVQKKITSIDILGFDFEMGLFPNIRDVASKEGVDLNCLYIPNDIFDSKAVKKHQIIFYNTAYIDAQIITKKDQFKVKLKGYSVFDSENQFEEALSELEKGEKREILMSNSIIKIQKNKDGKIIKDIIKMKWIDWIDYWSVDFDFENKKEFINDGKKDKWTGDYIFENEWQSFRTSEDEIEFETPYRTIEKGKKIAIKVIDIFGNDTMKILEL